MTNLIILTPDPSYKTLAGVEPGLNVGKRVGNKRLAMYLDMFQALVCSKSMFMRLQEED